MGWCFRLFLEFAPTDSAISTLCTLFFIGFGGLGGVFAIVSLTKDENRPLGFVTLLTTAGAFVILVVVGLATWSGGQRDTLRKIDIILVNKVLSHDR